MEKPPKNQFRAIKWRYPGSTPNLHIFHLCIHERTAKAWPHLRPHPEDWKFLWPRLDHRWNVTVGNGINFQGFKPKMFMVYARYNSNKYMTIWYMMVYGRYILFYTYYGFSIQCLGGSDKRSVWGIHIPYTYSIFIGEPFGATWSFPTID